MDIAQLADRLTAETAKIIYGKETQIRLIVMALLSQGHVLLEDLPGVGKTTLIKTLAAVSGCRSKRIQFVPDLLPADILGMNIYDRNRGEFRRLPGPVFTNLLLADEINRAVPRTQSALLEAMEERQVTIDGETLPLPTPFVVMDEIEAALDDNNVVRFARYMRSMAERTQFIVITHRRGTMEEADVLYGVTMQEQGVSKLLELRASEVEAKLGLSMNQA